MKKNHHMKWTWPAGRLLVVLGLAAMGSTLIFVQPALAGKPCEVPVDVTFRADPTDDIRSVAGAPSYTADIACGDGDLYFFYGPIEFKLDALGTVQSNGNMVVELGTAGGLLGMTVGQSLPTTKVQFTLVKDRIRYFLAFRNPMWPASDNILVTRVSLSEWEVEAAPPTSNSGWSAQLLTLSSGGRAYVPFAVETAVPFKMRLVKQPQP